MEPLFVIQHTIKAANKTKSPLWIALQDFNKAYDRVNVSLLKLALFRVKIPLQLANIYCDYLPINQNQVILHVNRISKNMT